MRLWVKLALMIVITVEVQMALPIVIRALGEVGDEINYSYAVRFGTPEDQVRVLERVAIRGGFHAASERWDQDNVRWLIAVRQADMARAAGSSWVLEPDPAQSPPASPNVPATVGGETGVASVAP